MNVIDAAFALIFQRGRAIGPIIPDITIREVHRDTLMITDHPVETGATISDHAFKRPKMLEMTCGWSDSSLGMTGYIDLVYQSLLALQQSRIPFVVLTGKRAYRDMLIEDLTVATDRQLESALVVVCRMREVIRVSVTTTATPASAQKAPQSTAPTAPTGQKTAYGFASPSARA